MDRLTQLQQWLDSLSENTYNNLQAASADASFRQYFRVTNTQKNKTYIVMDAPPEKENCKPFLQVTELIRNIGVNAPNVIAIDLQQGFILLDDLGRKLYLNNLDKNNADNLYIDAIDALIKMQNIDSILPVYNEALLQTEMDLFEEWYLNRHLDIKPDDAQKTILNDTFKILIQSALEQPQVFVHRDYHSRNLMVTNENNPGVIDYQDAVIGPITYDLVSLFKDCYIEWPREKVELWLDLYLARITPARLIDKETLLRWFDLMGVQRHLKVLGIFARLNYRDGKSQYLDDLPLTLKYITDTCELYEELQPLGELLKKST
ncbi:Phosphotransferase involved in threonylcarbamoyladenosine t(6)A37 formation in tRNA [hydrothermal vent metagenome]|uniref:Phosphotransferase involved in threonylcarbamoyladenosine t(6)A37 formation in tRNA n=1 Tax=hydrothermal vent metagenome TaxID=652676 RepID=A0A3B0W2P0_9ZZZZ